MWNLLTFSDGDVQAFAKLASLVAAKPLAHLSAEYANVCSADCAR